MRSRLGSLKGFIFRRRLPNPSGQPKAYYQIPVPAAAGPDLMVSFLSKDTMLPRRVEWHIAAGVIKCVLAPADRVELRLTWIAGAHLDGFRCTLGPASKFRVSGRDHTLT